MMLIEANAMQSTTQPSRDVHWLDAHIAAQAAHYGLSPKKKAELFEGAAAYGEALERGDVNEPVHE